MKPFTNMEEILGNVYEQENKRGGEIKINKGGEYNVFSVSGYNNCGGENP